MLGKRSDQRGLWEADRLYLDYVGKDTFYGLLAALRGQLFSDDDFAEIYCPDNGRDSVPPSLLATALLLQTYDRVSDAEARAPEPTSTSVGRWRWGLRLRIDPLLRVPFAKSTLQLFRAQLILHDKVREVVESSLRLARQSGYLKKRGMRVALDTTCILGRGAVTGCGEGHLQSAGGRDRQTVASPGGRGEHHLAGMGRSPEVREVPGFQHQGRGGDRLVGPQSAGGIAG